jgi:hypothetical protein
MPTTLPVAIAVNALPLIVIPLFVVHTIAAAIRHPKYCRVAQVITAAAKVDLTRIGFITDPTESR